MKNYILYLTVLSLFSIVSCSRDDVCSDDGIITFEKLIGTWKLTAAKISEHGNSPEWTPTDDGHTIKLNRDNTYEKTPINECSKGKYSIDDYNILMLIDSCENIKFFTILSLVNNTLILKDNSCIIEECLYKYKKIK